MKWEPPAMVAVRKQHRGREIVAEGVSMDEYKQGMLSKKYPAGSTFVAILGTIFAPIQTQEAAE